MAEEEKHNRDDEAPEPTEAASEGTHDDQSEAEPAGHSGEPQVEAAAVGEPSTEAESAQDASHQIEDAAAGMVRERESGEAPEDAGNEVDERAAEAAGRQPEQEGDIDLIEFGPRKPAGRRSRLVEVAAVLNVLFFGALLLLLLPSRGQEAKPAGGVTVVVTGRQTDTGESPGTREGGGGNEEAYKTALERAEGFYARGMYEEAITGYGEAKGSLPERPERKAFEAFLDYRVGRSLEELGHTDAALEAFEQLASGASWTVCVAAHSRAARLDLSAGRFREASEHAYRALCLTGFIEGREKLEHGLELVVAQALTSKALAFANMDDLDHGGKAHEDMDVDVFDGLGPEQLLTFVTARPADPMNEWLSAQGKVTASTSDAGNNVDVLCVRRPVEEIVSRVVAAGGTEVVWRDVPQSRRVVTVDVFLNDVAPDVVVERVTGAAGLIAERAGETTVLSGFPRDGSTSEQRKTVAAEAERAWRRFLIRHKDTPHLDHVYLSLGSLAAANGDLAVALARFKRLVNTMPRSASAPVALMNAGVILTRLRDYASAREHFLDLIDKYPRFGALPEAYIKAAEATAAIGRHGDAAKLYRRVLFLEFDAASTQRAVYELGRCMHAAGQSENAVAWLARFAKDYPDAEEVAEVHYLMGVDLGELDRRDEARTAFLKCRAADAGKTWTRLAMLALAEIEAQDENYVRALEVISEVGQQEDDPEALQRIAMLQAEVYLAMALPAMAVDALSPAPAGARGQENWKLLLMLAEAHNESGNPGASHALLERIMTSADPDVRARAMVVLAQTSKLEGRLNEAAQLLREVISRAPGGTLESRARKALGDILLDQDKYGEAAEVLAPAAEEGMTS